MLSHGRFDDALAHLRHAQAEEPLAANINANIGMIHYYAGRYHEAIAQLQATLELDTAFPMPAPFWGARWCDGASSSRRWRNFPAVPPKPS